MFDQLTFNKYIVVDRW